MSYDDDETVDWRAKYGRLEERLGTTLRELDDANLLLQQPPEWGNCRRGCSPAYLDREGFCSPACHWGAPKGRYVTSPEPQPTQGELYR